MSDARLWLYLVERWRLAGMGITGPTVPFLIGATRVVGLRRGIADISEVAASLYALQSATAHYIRIAPCGNPIKPVAALYERKMTMDSGELVKRTKGTSSLYISRDYRHRQDIESASAALWATVGSAITGEQYSFNGSKYGAYKANELGFIHGAVKV